MIHCEHFFVKIYEIKKNSEIKMKQQIYGIFYDFHYSKNSIFLR